MQVLVAGSIQFNGLNFNLGQTLNGDIDYLVSHQVPVAQPAVLTTRTSDTAGTLTMGNVEHGITTASLLDLYWSDGFAFQALVGTVSGTSVPFTLAQGDVMPIATKPMVVCIPVVKAFPLVTANLQLLGVQCDAEAQLTFMEADLSTVNLNQHLPAPAASGLFTQFSWYNGSGDANPITGTPVAVVYMSHADIANPHTLYATYLVS